MSLRATLKVGLAAGLVAGLVLGSFILLVMEPLIDEAKALEGGEEPVPAPVTKAVAFVGGVFVGVLVGIPFALVFPFVQSVLGWRSRVAMAGVYGGLAFGAFSLLPFLAVPGGPPGVDYTLDVAERQFWYVATMASAVGGLVAALGLYLLVRPQARTGGARLALLAASLAIAATTWALPLLLVPDSALITDLPLAFVQRYRVALVVQWALFWTVLSGSVALLWRRWESPA